MMNLKKSTLKTLVKEILKEIKLAHRKPSSSLFNVISMAHNSMPGFNNPKAGYKLANEIIKYIKDDIKELIVAMRDADQKKMNELDDKFDYHQGYLIQFIHFWARQFYENYEKHDETSRHQLRGSVSDLTSHVAQLRNQVDSIGESIITYKNQINAINEIKHLTQILNNISFSVDGIFSQNNLSTTTTKKKVWPKKK